MIYSCVSLRPQPPDNHDFLLLYLIFPNFGEIFVMSNEDWVSDELHNSDQSAFSSSENRDCLLIFLEIRRNIYL